MGEVSSLNVEPPGFRMPLITERFFSAVTMNTPIITLPGFIDCHVHFREPGFEYKATLQSEAIAAKHGGVCTVCEMPNTNPPTTTVAALRDKVKRADMVSDCDIHFYFGATEKSHLEELRRAWEDEDLRRRLCGLKLYFDHSTGNQKADSDVLEEAFAVCADLDIPLVGHCEDPEMNADYSARYGRQGASVEVHSKVRPPESEQKSIDYALSLAAKHNASFHVAHMSTSFGVDLVSQAKKDGLKITCEVTPHHLFLTVDDYRTLGTLGKMNPPLRTQEHRDALWDGILSGVVDCIATDHAPHTLSEKEEGDPLSAPSGVPGVETMIPLLLTVAAGKWPHPTSKKPSTEGLTVKTIEKLCFTNPNNIFRLGKSPTEDTSMVDLDAEWELRADRLHSKCGWTPYEGWKVCRVMQK